MPGRANGRAFCLATFSRQPHNKLVLTCHDLSPLSSPADGARWIFMARLYFVNGYVLDVSRCSGSAGTAIAGNATAARRAGLRLGAGSGGAPTAVISGARKGGSITGTANANTGGAVLA
jgi:hypothetical protein